MTRTRHIAESPVVLQITGTTTVPFARTTPDLFKSTDAFRRGWCLGLAFVLFVLCGIGEPIHYYLHAVAARSAQSIAPARHALAAADKATAHIDARAPTKPHSCALCDFVATPRLNPVVRVGVAFAPVRCLSPIWLARPPSASATLPAALLRSRAPPFHVA